MLLGGGRRLDPDRGGVMEFEEKHAPAAFAVPIRVPRAARRVAGRTEETPPAVLVELFEPSSPTRPHRSESVPRRRSWIADAAVSSCRSCARRFTLFLRRHHCRRCGSIFCNDCSNNRVTHLRGADDHNHYRLCGPCIDELVEQQQAVLVPTERCGFGAGAGVGFSLGKVAAVVHEPSAAPAAPVGRPAGEPNADDNLLRFDEEIVASPPSHAAAANTAINSINTTANTHMRASLSALPFSPVLSHGSTPTNEGVLSRLATAALSLPARLRVAVRAADPQYVDPTLESCPVCSLSFRRWSQHAMQRHVEDCIRAVEATGAVLGDRYSVHRWPAAGERREGKECAICFDEFAAGQRIAVLNCFCQFHERCIDSWFERGKCCPFHAPK